MVVIPAGSFMMGSPESEPGRNSNEGPQHRVSVAKFAMGQYEVTQGQWKALMGSNPGLFTAT
jgi:formylglycine-generating enzyme required for sulfatase activity